MLKNGLPCCYLNSWATIDRCDPIWQARKHGFSIWSRSPPAATGGDTRREPRRHGGTEARRHGGTEARRHGGTEARRHEGTKARMHGCTEARMHEGTDARRHGGTKENNASRLRELPGGWGAGAE
ncbi:hypothetical protein Mal4_20080 [Maioricimonas rarisocia]|uniref:Uncharacterized protein n=1 Tax=Maioricimonas rarisocia TaxID=2528026 RepID=A0A517Z5D0_9PLAN|nr:hypothetical protein Mal4_20080 [Maioricimonas rarisocia]